MASYAVVKRSLKVRKVSSGGFFERGIVRDAVGHELAGALYALPERQALRERDSPQVGRIQETRLRHWSILSARTVMVANIGM